MEQHNIDSRFKQGLENLNRQPSMDAWARLQSKMQETEAAPEPILAEPEKKEERRIFMWWHYAAAAVVLLFVTFGIVKNGTNFGGKTAPEVAVNVPNSAPEIGENSIETPVQAQATVKENAPENAIAKIENSDKTAPEKITENAIENGSKTASVKIEKQFKPEVENALAAAKPKKKRTPIVDPETLPVAKTPTAQPEENMLAANQPSEVKKPETKTATWEGMPIEVIVKKDRSDEMLAMNQPTENEEKDSKLKSIFKQARNLKNGEKVDLQAIGVTPDSKLAMGTRSITQKVSKVLDI